METRTIRFMQGHYTTYLITRELHKSWYETTEHKDIDTYAKFRRIWDIICLAIEKELLTNPDGVRLGNCTGELKLRYTNSYREPVERKAAIAGKKIKHLNWNTTGRLGKIIWSTYYSRKCNGKTRLYAFKPNPRLVEKLAKGFKLTPEIYKDNRISHFSLKVKKDKTNPWLHGQDILKKPIETVNNHKRSNIFGEEGPEGG